MSKEEVRAGIETPQANDVLCGRGGMINKFPGNLAFIDLVKSYRAAYVQCGEFHVMVGAMHVSNSISHPSCINSSLSLFVVLLSSITDKAQKKVYSKKVYKQVRKMDPPGRFLKQDPVTKLWNDIGKKAALCKIRQALREGEIRWFYGRFLLCSVYV
jgi:hypothetical protein